MNHPLPRPLLSTLAAVLVFAALAASSPQENRGAGVVLQGSGANVLVESSTFQVPARQAAIGCGCPAPVYLRASSSVTLTGNEDFVELDTDSGNPIVLTLPAAPTKLQPLEVWLGSQPGLPGGTVTIDPNGQPTTGADLLLDVANEGRLLLYVKPTPTGGGYWRITDL